jgi:hypothetical protein
MNSSQPQKAPLSVDVNGPVHVDALGRTGFARELLEVIRLLPADGGAVVGLEGEWGSGKTWVLDQLERADEKHDEKDKLLFVKFNPWMLGGSAEIVDAYLIQLASTLGTKDKPNSLVRGAEIAGKLIDYTRVLSTVKHFSPLANLLLPGSGLLLDAVGHAAGEAASATKESTGGLIDRWKKEPGKLSLTAAREAVRTLLQSAERRIAVLVDDLDRLAPAELAAMVQAVKAVADFPNVVYVLAYDPGAAAHALEEALRLRDGEGLRYLEKIVQFPMPIPEAPAFKMQAFATGRFRAALPPADETDENDMTEALPRAAALMRSPRDVLRLETRLLLSGRRLISEISPADVLLVEAINLKAPHIIEYVHQHPREMLKISNEAHDEDRVERGELGDLYEMPGESQGATDEQRRETKWRALRKHFEQPIDDRRLLGPIRSAVGYLFDEVPRLRHSRGEPHASRNRIQRLRNWSRWRAQVKHDEYLENSEVSDLLRRPLEVRHSPAWADTDSFLKFCGLAADLAGETQGVDAVAFVEMFAKAAQQFGEQPLRHEPRFIGFGPQDALIAVMRSDRVRGWQAVECLIETCSVWLSEHVVWTVRAEALGTPSHSPAAAGYRLVDDEDVVRKLIQQWQDKAADWLRNVSEPTVGRPAFSLACWMCNMGGDPASLRQELSRIVESCPRGLEICFCDPSYSDPIIRHVGIPNRDLLPEPTVLQAAVSRSPGFESGHGLLLNWRIASAAATDPPNNQAEAPSTAPDASAPATAAARHPAGCAPSPPPPRPRPPAAPPAPCPTGR